MFLRKEIIKRMKNKKDRIFNTPLEEIVDFKFDEKVANVFEDMLHRSIPGYSTIINMIGMFGGNYAKEGTNVYDLGCSLGAASFAVQNKTADRNVNIIAIDNSPHMIERAKAFDQKNNLKNIEFVCDDVMNVNFQNASLVISNFTLQFIPVEQRETLLKRIYDGMVDGGVLVISEKISFEDKSLEERQVDRYYNFKRLNGYTEMEISQKREALENVLIPETIDTHFNRFKRAGFSNYDIWFQCFNFTSMIAEK